MKRFLVALVLNGVLAVSVMGGDISTSGSPAPASSGTTQTATTTQPGDMPISGDAEQISSDALSVLLSVLSFLAL